jgi:hypothetical protein
MSAPMSVQPSRLLSASGRPRRIRAGVEASGRGHGGGNAAQRPSRRPRFPGRCRQWTRTCSGTGRGTAPREDRERRYSERASASCGPRVGSGYWAASRVEPGFADLCRPRWAAGSAADGEVSDSHPGVSMATSAPRSRASATAARLSRSSAACRAGRRCPAVRRSTTDGAVARLAASSPPKSVSADTRSGHQNASLTASEVEDVPVGCRAKTTIPDVADVVTVFGQRCDELRGQVVVEQQLHAVTRSGSSRSRSASAA